MKKATRYLKQLFSAVVAVVKSTAASTKGSSLRTRLIVLSIMRNKKLLLSAIQSKIHAIMGGAGAGGSGQGGHGIAPATTSHGGGEAGGAGEHLLLGGAGAGGRKAAMLQNLPSFVVEQESRAVVLSSLPSFVLERAAGGGEEEAEHDGDGNNGGEKQAATGGGAPGSSGMEVGCGAAAEEGEFRLEDEIDRVADVFIRRFHDQMKLQKLESFKRFCEMLERGA